MTQLVDSGYLSKTILAGPAWTVFIWQAMAPGLPVRMLRS
jgi:hypothetical protein